MTSTTMNFPYVFLEMTKQQKENVQKYFEKTKIHKINVDQL